MGQVRWEGSAVLVRSEGYLQGMRPALHNFVDPPTTPIDLQAELSRIPADARIGGLFLGPLARQLRERGAELSELPAHFEDLQQYPLSLLVTLLAEASRTLFPELPLRVAMRKLGRQAMPALLQSPVGRLALGAAQGMVQTLEAVAKSYNITLHPSRAEVIHKEPGLVVVRLTNVYHFLDSHHVGVFEGALRLRKVKGKVLIHQHSPSSADYLCRWDV